MQRLFLWNSHYALQNILLIIFQCIFSGLLGIINHDITLVDTFLPLSSTRPDFSIQIYLASNAWAAHLLKRP